MESEELRGFMSWTYGGYDQRMKHARVCPQPLPILAVVALLGWVASPTARAEPRRLSVSPPAVHLDASEASQQLLVTDLDEEHRRVDRTRAAGYRVADPAVVDVAEGGRVQPLSDGTTTIEVNVDGSVVTVPVTVDGLARPRPVSFENEIVPILSKAGCNSGSCHGKQFGQNHFELSVFGNDPLADYEQIVIRSRGRRVLHSASDRSLFLLKATAEVAHGGGRRFDWNSPWFRRVARWISEGSPFRVEDHSPVASIEVEPEAVEMTFGSSFQLVVTAVHEDGRRVCVTREGEYESNSLDIATVDEQGLVTAGQAPGEAGILVRHQGKVTVCRVTVPQPGVEFKRPLENNFVDTHVWNKLDRLGIQPSLRADDGMFLRRVYLDVIGTLPTAEEAGRFLRDASPGKRSRLIDQLLDREEYADYQALLWADLLRVDRIKLTPRGAVAITRWLRKQFAENTPYDVFVRQILTASGNTFAEGPASFFQAIDKPDLLAESVSQVFLGVRLNCAKCHDHPSDIWQPRDYYGFAGFFTGVGKKPAPGGGQVVFATDGADAKDARGNVVPTALLGAAPADFSKVQDRRRTLADWVTAPTNPYFAKLMVNRLWARYFGRGLVEPLDDLRETNPPTNPELLDALAQHLIDQNFDLKAVTRTLLNSRVYQLTSDANEFNIHDRQNFSHAQYRAMPAEVLLDAISQVTGVPEEFPGWPKGKRAIEIWDNRMESYFFKIFGRPTRVTVCSCERGNEPSIAQALHLMNSAEVADKIWHRDGRARILADSGATPEELVGEICLTVLSRYPDASERELLLEVLRTSSDDRRKAVEDVFWVLLNTRRFLFVH